MKENHSRHVCWMYIHTAYSIGSKASAYRKSIVVARYIWKQMNVAKNYRWLVSTTKNYHCSQAVIGQLCIVSYRWLANSIMSTIITIKTRLRLQVFLRRSFTPFYLSKEYGDEHLVKTLKLYKEPQMTIDIDFTLHPWVRNVKQIYRWSSWDLQFPSLSCVGSSRPPLPIKEHLALDFFRVNVPAVSHLRVGSI